MDIVYKNYLLKQSGDRFDLCKQVTRKNRETDEIYVKEDILGYSMKLENAIKRLINEELSDKKEVVTLQEYLEAFKTEKEELLKCIENYGKI